MGQVRNTKILSKIFHRRDSLGDLGVDGRMMLKWVLERLGVMVWAGFNWAGLLFSVSTSNSTKGGKFLDQLSNCELFKQDAAP
jgi:hypothetical protein